jgi:hypothetical protein
MKSLFRFSTLPICLSLIFLSRPFTNYAASGNARSEDSTTHVTYAPAGTAVSVNVNCTSNDGTVNPLTWGVGAPDKYMWWPGNAALKQRISDAKIKLVRVSPVQLGKYNNRDMYPSTNTWNFTDMDLILNSIFDAGAQPIFQLCGYPAGVPAKNWTAYAQFMDGVIKRYNVQKVLGATRTIKYWEMWNEPTIEGDGVLSMAEYKSFVETVGTAMKAVDASIKIIGPADAWADLRAWSGTDGWSSYVAKNLESQVDILSWHNYGPDPSRSDLDRMTWQTPSYYSDFLTVQSGGEGNRFVGPSGKKYGTALTEYNMSHQDGGATYNVKYHSEYNATFTASAILNALKAKVDLFCFYNLSETGTNLLGLLTNSGFAPYKPYYTFYLFGNYTGNRALAATGGASALEYYASKDTVSGKYYVTLINKDVNSTVFDVTVNLNNIASATGSVIVRTVDATTNPTTSTTISYTNSKFTYSIPAYSVVSLEVAAPVTTSAAADFTFMVYPNPLHETTTIQLDMTRSKSPAKSVLLELFDITGKRVKSSVFNGAGQKAAPTQMVLQRGTLPSGVYLLKVTAGGKSVSKKLVIE